MIRWHISGLSFCLLIASCGSNASTIGAGFLDTFGGPTVLTADEMVCVKRNPQLREVVEVRDPKEFREILDPVFSSAVECFSVRWAAHVVGSNTDVGECQRKVLIRELKQSSLEGGRSMQAAFEIGSPKSVAECGRIP
jgi:hypothetical protein